MATVLFEHAPLPGETPSFQADQFLDNALQDFAQAYAGLRGRAERLPLVLGLALDLRTGLGDYLDDPTNLRTRARLDAIEWTAWKDMYGYETDHASEAERRAIGEEKLAAEERYYQDLDLHGRLFGNDARAKDELVEDLFLARQLVENPEGRHGQDRTLDRIELGRMLANHRLLKAVQGGGFQRARRAGLEERRQKITLVIPLGRDESRQINLCMQPAFRLAPFEVMEYCNNLLVNMTPDLNKGDSFNMPGEDQAALRQAIAAQRGKLIGLVPLAGALQTEVDAVQ